MKHFSKPFLVFCLALFFNYKNNDGNILNLIRSTKVSFQCKTTIHIVKEEASKTLVYPAFLKKVFAVNVESNPILANNILNLESPFSKEPIDLSSFGIPNNMPIQLVSVKIFNNAI